MEDGDIGTPTIFERIALDEEQHMSCLELQLDQVVEKEARRSHDYLQLVETLNKLGIACEDVALDKLDSASAEVCSFPMYMVANAGTLVDDTQSKDKNRDLLGIGKLRESFVIGERESETQQAFDFRADHLETLHGLMTPGPSDQVAYNDAVEAIRLFFSCAEPSVVVVAKHAIARMIASVAHAAGEGLFGSAAKPPPPNNSASGNCVMRSPWTVSPAQHPNSPKSTIEKVTDVFALETPRRI